MIVLKEFEFDAAHYLPSYNGKCEHLHGHTYKLVVKVDGVPDMEGMVLGPRCCGSWTTSC